MVIYENLENNLVRAYSDAGMLIHGGNPEGDYAEAIDPAELHRTYAETDTPIPADPATDEDYMTIGKIMMGVEE